MSHLQIRFRRAVGAPAVVLSLMLLAGCQSDAGDPDRGPSTTDLAITGDGSVPIGEGSLPTLAEQLVQVGDRVYFALDRYDLSPEAEATLRRQAALLLEAQPPAAVSIEGHADERGTREYNLALGERRAASVRNYFIALGIPGERISVVSYGKERPECAAAVEACWAQNRRGVTVVSQ